MNQALTRAALRAARRIGAPLGLLLIPAATLAQSGAALLPEQVVALQAVSSAVMSPDGERIAFTLTEPRDSAEERGAAYSELRIVARAGGASRVVVERPRSASHPRWSPDGRRLAFVARLDAHDQAQVYTVDAAGGAPQRLTSAATGVGTFEWSPDGASLAYTSPVPRPETGRESANDVILVSEQGRRARLWLQPLAGEARALTPDTLHVAALAWAPDGSRLAIQATRETGADADLMHRRIFILTTAGELRPFIETEGKLGPMAWSPDAVQLAWLGATSFNDPLAQSVFVASAEGGRPHNLTPGFEGSATDLAWLDGETIAFVAATGTRGALHAVAAAGGDIELLAGGGEEVVAGVSFARDARSFAAVAHSARHPGEVYTGELAGAGRVRAPATLARTTSHNTWLADVELGEQRTIAWRGPEGLRIEGVLTLPVGYRAGARYPLAILPHGGPEGISFDGWTTNPLYPVQVLAGRGYVVLQPNYRGSGGRGVAFSKADHRDLGGKEFDDVLAGIDHLSAQGIVDPERVGISGTSYGGYFSAWAATRHSERFRVAIPFAGLTNWTSFTLTTDIPIEMQAVHFDLYWDEAPGIYRDRSPITHIERARTPTLIGHGLADDRVHPEQSLELYNALRLKGVPVELVQYPREPHGLRERAHQLDYMRRIIEWLDRYLKPDGAVTL
ncbi:MAG: S9 family peptidase [Longimicrobiales bacterium]